MSTKSMSQLLVPIVVETSGRGERAYDIYSRLLKERINNWRWSLAWAALPAVAVGLVAKMTLPEWAEILFGVPAILAVYVWIIWHKGFGPEDRMLFRKTAPAAATA